MTAAKKPKKEEAEEPHRGPHMVPHTDEDAKKDLQRKYMQLQMLRQYLMALTEEKSKVEARLEELAVTSLALNKFHEIAKGEEMWSSLGSDCFALADIKDVHKVIVGIGSGIFVKKSVTEAKVLIQARTAEMQKIDTELTAEMQGLSEQAAKLEPEIQRLAQVTQ